MIFKPNSGVLTYGFSMAVLWKAHLITQNTFFKEYIPIEFNLTQVDSKVNEVIVLELQNQVGSLFQYFSFKLPIYFVIAF